VTSLSCSGTGKSVTFTVYAIILFLEKHKENATYSVNRFS
jgi:hypothetical protein